VIRDTIDQEDSPLIFLVVDDDKSMRMLLEQKDTKLLEAQDGEACLAAYQHCQPDAIFALDAVMRKSWMGCL